MLLFSASFIMHFRRKKATCKQLVLVWLATVGIAIYTATESIKWIQNQSETILKESVRESDFKGEKCMDLNL